MNRLLMLLIAVVISAPAGAADDEAMRVSAEWAAIRNAAVVTHIEWEMSMDSPIPNDRRPKESWHRFTADWKANKFFWQTLIKDKNSNFKLYEQFSDGKKIVKRVFRSDSVFAHIGEAEKNEIVDGDMKNISIEQRFHPLFLDQGVVLTYGKRVYLPNDFFFEADPTGLYMAKKDGALIYINAYPNNGGKQYSYWQYTADQTKNSAIVAASLWEHFDGKAERAFTRNDMEYLKVGSRWRLSGWKSTDFLDGKKWTTYTAQVTRYEILDSFPEFEPSFREGERVRRETLSVFDPLNREPNTVKDLVERDGELIPVPPTGNSPWNRRLLWIALTIAIVLGIVIFFYRYTRRS